MKAGGGTAAAAVGAAGGQLAGGAAALGAAVGEQPHLDCPICLSTLADPFVTPCGHTFCYGCISAHLAAAKNCPSCLRYLTKDLIYPNFLLAKIVQQAQAAPSLRASAFDLIERCIREGEDELTLAQIDALLGQLRERKRAAEQCERDNNMGLLLHFLQRSRQDKFARLEELRAELACLDHDIRQVEGAAAAPAGGGQPDGEPQPAGGTSSSVPAVERGDVMEVPQAHLTAAQHAEQEARAPEGSAGAEARVAEPNPAQQPQQQCHPAGGWAGQLLGQPWPAHWSLHPAVAAQAAVQWLPAPLPQLPGLQQQLAAWLQEQLQAQAAGGAGAAGAPAQAEGSGPAERPGARTVDGGGAAAGAALEVAAGSAGGPHEAASSSPAEPAGGGNQAAGSGKQQQQQQQQQQQPGSATAHQAAQPAVGGLPGSGAQTVAAAIAALVTGVGHPMALLQGGLPGGPSSPDAAAAAAAAAGGPAMLAPPISPSWLHAPAVAALASHSQGAAAAGADLADGTVAGVGALDDAARQKRRRIASQFEDLQECYRLLRAGATGMPAAPLGAAELPSGGAASGGAGEGSATREGAVVAGGLAEFGRVLSVLARCNTLKVAAAIPKHSSRGGSSSSIISSLEFDREGARFATAGVSKRISVYEYASLERCASLPMLPPPTPVLELVTRSKLSCLAWNPHVSNHIASSDYEGVVAVWDVATSALVLEYEAHSKRIWSLDYCAVAHPALLASASDDCTVKLWSPSSPNSVGQVDLKANVCAVKWRPGSQHELAVGSADHCVYLYDMRATARPLATCTGHRKAVSYVRFCGAEELVSASTDSTLRLWGLGGDGKTGTQQRVFEGHLNEKNFVGLAVEGDFLACGSESSEVFVYYKALSKPIAQQSFLTPAPGGSDEGGGGAADARESGRSQQFISAVCWRPGSHDLLVANSHGSLKLMQLTAAGSSR